MYNPVPDLPFIIPTIFLFLGLIIGHVFTALNDHAEYIRGLNEGIERTIIIMNKNLLTDPNVSYGELIKYCRKKKKLSQIKLAEKSGVNANTILNVENGKSDPRISTCDLLLDAMGYEIIIREKEEEL